MGKSDSKHRRLVKVDAESVASRRIKMFYVNLQSAF